MHAKLDLGQTELDLPAIAWKKGAGVPADLAFVVRRDGDTTQLDKLELKGDGFQARGSLSVDKRGLRSAALTRVALNPRRRRQRRCRAPWRRLRCEGRG